jgi:hypothetical protein
MTIKVKLQAMFVKLHEKGGRNFLAGIVAILNIVLYSNEIMNP